MTDETKQAVRELATALAAQNPADRIIEMTADERRERVAKFMKAVPPPVAAIAYETATVMAYGVTASLHTLPNEPAVTDALNALIADRAIVPGGERTRGGHMADYVRDVVLLILLKVSAIGYQDAEGDTHVGKAIDHTDPEQVMQSRRFDGGPDGKGH